METDIKRIALSVIEKELKAVNELTKHVNKHFTNAIKMLSECKGKIVILGMGKSGIIGQKIASTLSSTGTVAFFLNPAECGHGDLGVIVRKDNVLALSKSGETGEIVKLLPYMKRFGIKVITMTSDAKSTLARGSDEVILIGDIEEACPFNLAPTSSSTAMLVMGDAIAVSLLKIKKFKKEDFAVVHPGGDLGRRLMKVEELMHKGRELPLVYTDTNMRDVLAEIITKKFGVAMVINKAGYLKGIIVDGDLKRILIKDPDIMKLKAGVVMTKNPKTIRKTELIESALNTMEGKITSLIVTDFKKKPVGLIHIHDILKTGVM